MEKTNVMRLLDGKKIKYTPHQYDNTITDGETIASILNQDAKRVFKTLVTRSNTNTYYVFVVPVCESLNLKKAAKAVGAKSIEMIKQKELLPLTGYIHGGCSPIGMKKAFKTVFHNTFTDFETVMFSAGKVGYQVEINPQDAISYIGAETADLTDEKEI